MFLNKIDLLKGLKAVFIGFVFTLAITVATTYIYFNRQGAPKSKATGEVVNLTFTPATVTAGATKAFTVAVKARPTVDMMIQGYVVLLKFDTTKVRVTSVQYNFSAQSVGLADNNNTLARINKTGYVRLIGESRTTTGKLLPAASNTKIATIAFNSKTASPYTIDVGDYNNVTAKFYRLNSDKSLSEYPVVSTALSVNGANVSPGVSTNPSTSPGVTISTNPNITTSPTATPSATIGATLPAGAVRLNLKLKFQGIEAKPADDFNKLAVQVRLSGRLANAPTEPQTGDFIANDKGVWSGSVTFAGVDLNQQYKILVKGPKHMQKKICNALPMETSVGSYRCSEGSITLHAGENNLDFSGITLLVGDLPTQNGLVDSYDISLVRNNLGKTDAATLRLADLNLDGIVDTQDYSLLIAALSNRSDEE